MSKESKRKKLGQPEAAHTKWAPGGLRGPRPSKGPWLFPQDLQQPASQRASLLSKSKEDKNSRNI